MHLTKKNEHFVIIDNFLPEDCLSLIWNFILQCNFSPVHVGLSNSPWSATDGMPLTGKPILLDKGMKKQNEHNLGRFDKYPTNTPIDMFIDNIMNNMDEFCSYVGQPKEVWNCMSVSPFIYPQSTGLSWHSDSISGNTSIYSGAYSFYIHPGWKDNWGGELMIQSPINNQPNSGNNTIKNMNRFSSRDRSFNSNYDGQYIMPNQNRFILLKSGTWHKINTVNKAAGNRVRVSLSGFFFKPEK